jgi:single-strand DNA-binding protein
MNKAMLMGRLTKDPELRYTNNNVAWCTFSLAVNRRFNKPGEEKQADFINIVAWEKNADFCSKYFKKGQQVVVIGRIQTRTWDDDKGVRHYVTEVVSEENYFADSKGQGDGTNVRPQNNETSTPGFFPVDNGEDELPF